MFENKPLSQISDDDIDALVREHVSESQQLEFKLTINYQDDSNKLELLKDITSLVNGGGGYLIVGIREDGNGNALRFEPDCVGDTERIKMSIRDLCIEHISERIEGIEVQTRTIIGNPIVIVRIPKSESTPHMVSYQRKTDFFIRHSDGKREMTIGEIRGAFNKDFIDRRLSHIENSMQQIVSQIKPLEINVIDFEGDLLAINDGARLNEIAKTNFIQEIDTNPYLYLSITPQRPNVDLLDLSSTNIKPIINNPPGSRKSGWNVDFSYFNLNKIREGIEIGRKDYKYLKLMDNGHMELWVPLDDTFCWRQPIEEFKIRPRLYPYPVTEYPVTFLRLYKKLFENINSDEGFIFSMYYANLKEYFLPPYSPGTAGFDFPISRNPFEEQNFSITQNIPNDFDPEKKAFDSIKRFYFSFGHEAETIPFYNSREGKFDFS